MYELIVTYKISIDGEEKILEGDFLSFGETIEESIETARPEIDKFLTMANGILISIN